MIVLALAALLAASPAPAHPLRDRADLSFSPIPLGTRMPPRQLGLTELREGNCHEERECGWADGARVRHDFRIGDELVVKSVLAREGGDGEIAALGIGRARSRAAVLANVRAFLPQVAIRCEAETAAAEPGDWAAPALRCEGRLDQGWFRLWFDSRGRLTEARLDARHFS